MGGGSKHKFRIIDFFRKKKDMKATVERIEYDPNRTAYIALITYEDKEKAYIISPQGLKMYSPGFGFQPNILSSIKDIG